METITLDYKITFGEYLGLTLMITYRRTLILIITALGLLVCCIGLGKEMGIWDFQLLSSAVATWSYGLFMILFVPLLNFWKASRQYLNLQRLHELRHLEITRETIRLSGEAGSTEYKWAALKGFQELAAWILLSPNKMELLFIPKRAFTPAQWTLLQDIIKAQPKIVGKWRK